jgi:hypothetical protein
VTAADSPGAEPATLQSSIEDADSSRAADAGTARAFADPVALLAHLDASGHFHRDGRAGRLYHRGMVSFREDVPTDSLHLVVDENRLAAHVDAISPLAVDAPTSRYSAGRALAHNVAGMTIDVVGLLRGRQGDHSCVLNCEWIAGESHDAPVTAALLDPAAGAWSVQIEARVAGRLSEARLRAAVRLALGPSRLEHDVLEVVVCDDDDALAGARSRLQSLVVPVTSTPPVRVHLARHPAGDLLMLNLNHAAADGVAALSVLDCIARAYAGDALPGGPLDFLAGRDLPVRPASPSASVAARAGTRALEWLRDVLARTGRLAADEASDRPGYGFHHVALSPQQTAHVVDVDRAGTSRNVVMAALHLAIGDWNREHGAPGRRIGVLVPADLRPPGWRDTAIGNFSVTARVSTNRRERRGAAAALKAITSQTTRNKRTRTGIALIAGLQRAGLTALWAKQSTIVLEPLTGNRLVDTAMLCNLGTLDAPSFGPDAGDALELWFSAPARSPLSLSIGAISVGGRLHLTLRYPLRLFGPDAARRFGDCYLGALQRTAGAPPA